MAQPESLLSSDIERLEALGSGAAQGTGEPGLMGIFYGPGSPYCHPRPLQYEPFPPLLMPEISHLRDLFL